MRSPRGPAILYVEHPFEQNIPATFSRERSKWQYSRTASGRNSERTSYIEKVKHGRVIHFFQGILLFKWNFAHQFHFKFYIPIRFSPLQAQLSTPDLSHSTREASSDQSPVLASRRATNQSMTTPTPPILEVSIWLSSSTPPSMLAVRQLNR